MITYLYIKQHKSTGLKYFGKTIKDPYIYKGSGSYWTSHLRKHGYEVDTLAVWPFDDQEACTQFALQFSKENNIVESTEWANLRYENGLDGNVIGITLSEEHRQKISRAHRGRKRVFSESHRENLSKSKTGKASPLRGRTHSADTRAKISAAQLGKKRGPYKKKTNPS